MWLNSKTSIVGTYQLDGMYVSLGSFGFLQKSDAALPIGSCTNRKPVIFATVWYAGHRVWATRNFITIVGNRWKVHFSGRFSINILGKTSFHRPTLSDTRNFFKLSIWNGFRCCGTHFFTAQHRALQYQASEVGIAYASLIKFHPNLTMQIARAGVSPQHSIQARECVACVRPREDSQVTDKNNNGGFGLSKPHLKHKISQNSCFYFETFRILLNQV